MFTVSRMGFAPVTTARPKQTAPVQFGVSARYRDVYPSFEVSGRTASAQGCLELRKDATGDPLVRVIRDQKSLKALTQALNIQVPVDFLTQGVLAISKENGEKLSRAYMNIDAADRTNTLDVKLDSRPTGVVSSILSYSYYIAVVPKDRLTSQPKVTL